jgi:type II secretory pathway component PulJ
VELLAVIVALALLALVFLAIGKWYPGTGAEVLDWQPTRSYEDEIRLEIEDIDEMLEASNERRRRTGRPELTEDAVRQQVERDLMDQQQRQDDLKDEGGADPDRRP